MNRSRGFQNGWWLVFLTIGVMYIAAAPFILTSTESFMYMMCSELVLIIPIIVGLFMINSERENIRLSETLGIKGFSLKILPFLIIIAPCAQLFQGFVFAPMNAVTSFLFGPENYEELLQGAGINSVLWNFIVICIMAPVIEELLCRGVLMQLFKRYGIASMLLFSSLAFALMHQSAVTLIPIFFLGLLIGIVRITTGSVFACMVVHSASNLFSLIALYSGEMNFFVESFLVIILSVLFPILMWKFLTKYTNVAEGKETNYLNKSNPGISIGLILCCVFYIILNISMLISRLFSGELFYELSMFLG